MYKQSNCTLRDKLGDICERVDQVLADLEVTGAELIVTEVFGEDLTPGESALLKREFPILQHDRNAKQRYLNMVSQSACGTDFFSFCPYKKRWSVNTSKQMEQIGVLYHYIRVNDEDEEDVELPSFAFVGPV